MSETAIDRTSRALDLIPFITANPGWTVAELAKKFETSPSQIFKDLEMLFMCGLPGYSHLELIDVELNEDYVAINNPQNLDRPRKLSRAEVTVLAMGLELLIPFILDEKLAQKAISLKKRIQKLLKDQPSTISKVLFNSPVIRTPHDEAIAESMRNKSAIEISYRSARTDTISQRLIYPLRTYSQHGFLYTVAFCTKVDEERHFRHDRILESTMIPLSSRASMKEVSPDSLKTFEVKVVLAKQNRYFLEEHHQIVKDIESQAEGLLATFEIGDRAWLLRELISIGGAVRVISPVEFKDDFERKVSEIMALYGESL